MLHPTLNNPFDRAAIRRMLLCAPPDAINRPGIAEEAARFLEIVHAHYGGEGVQRFLALMREEAYAMARENAERRVVIQIQPAKGSGALAVVVLVLLFALGWLLGAAR